MWPLIALRIKCRSRSWPTRFCTILSLLTFLIYFLPPTSALYTVLSLYWTLTSSPKEPCPHWLLLIDTCPFHHIYLTSFSSSLFRPWLIFPYSQKPSCLLEMRLGVSPMNKTPRPTWSIAHQTSKKLYTLLVIKIFSLFSHIVKSLLASELLVGDELRKDPFRPQTQRYRTRSNRDTW